MTTRVDTEEITTTRSERVLAVVLTVFLLIGAGWLYAEIADWTHGEQDWSYTAAEEAAFEAESSTQTALLEAQRELEASLTDLELAQQRLRLALEADEPTEALEDSLAAAEQTYDAARAEADEARVEADAAQERAEEARTAAQERQDGVGDAGYWAAAGLRLLFVAGLLLGSLRLLERQRERESRYLALGFSAVATAAIMAVVFAVDYVTDYIDVLSLGPIVLSVIGAGATILAFRGLQRYLARRVPRSRVRKGDCPFCGFPVRGEGPHCEGCGREVVGRCAACAATRRIGSPHCPSCGSA